MQFRINITGSNPDIDAIEAAIRTVDPAGVADIDQGGTTLRVNAALEATELPGLLGTAGQHIALEQVELVPSECCGGCGG